MYEPMEAAIRHARFLAKYLHKCSSQYVIHLALKEIGIPSGKDGFHYAKNSVSLLLKDPYRSLKNDIYCVVGAMRNPRAEQEQVEQSIRFGIRIAWDHKNEDIWECYFPKCCRGSQSCPPNRDFLMAITDFIELWEACCEEVTYETIEQ